MEAVSNTLAEHEENWAGADRGFLERRYIYLKVLGFTLLISSHFFVSPAKHI